MVQQQGQFEEEVRLREEAADEAAKAGMIGTAGNVLTTGALVRAMTKQPGEPFFGGLLGGGKTPVYGEPLVSTGVTADPSTFPRAAYTTIPATTDLAATGISGTGPSGFGAVNAPPAVGGLPSGEIASSGFAGSTAPTTSAGGVVSGIGGGVATAVPYYGAAKLGGVLAGQALGEENVFAQSLDRPLNVEATYLEEAGVLTPEVQAGLDLLNPLGLGERVISDEVGTVICTEMHRQGYIDDKTLAADASFGKKQDLTVISGYHAWAIPLAAAMKKSKAVTKIVKPIALAWAENMAYSEGIRNKPNIIGAIIHKIGVPVCKLIGTLRRGVAWQA